ncbi:MAG: hypothetical protein M1813_006181 [Trichoglossum hirsutum]|nr:MAG: hypothetical protein M1813_006181 [Trichoglossum hirsutum]
MDIPSIFQEEIDWVFDHVSSREETESQGPDVESCCDLPATLPHEIEITPAAPSRASASCDRVIEDSTACESYSCLLDIPTESISSTVDLTKDSGAEWKLMKNNEQVPGTDALEGRRPTKYTRQANEGVPSESDVRTLDDGLRVFHSNPNVPVRLRKRKSFGPQRKKEVSVVRQIAACIQCRFRKKTCGDKNPCISCIALGGSMEIGYQLCFRSTLMKARYTDYGTQILLRPHRGTDVIQQGKPVETVYLSIMATRDALVLEVSVTEAQFVESVWNSNTGTYETQQIHGYVLAPNALPSKESLVRLAMECGWRTYARPWIVFSACCDRHNLPQSSLLRSAVMFWSLKALLRRCFFVVDKPRGVASRLCPRGGGDWFVAPSVIHSQLETLIRKVVDDVERAFLRELERAVLDTSSSSRDKVLPLFLSIWILGHTYAFFAVVASIYGDRKEEEFFDYMNRLSRAIKQARFRSSHPLDEANWSKNPDHAIMRNDPELLKTMSEIRTWEKGEYNPSCIPLWGMEPLLTFRLTPLEADEVKDLKFFYRSWPEGREDGQKNEE